MKKFVCIACSNEYDNKQEAEECCGEEAEEVNDDEINENQTEIFE